MGSSSPAVMAGAVSRSRIRPAAAHSLLLLLALVVALTAGAGKASAATFLVTNQCPFPVWPAAIPIPTGGGAHLEPGEAWLFTVPAGTKAGRVWGRTGCHFPAGGEGHGWFGSGDCAGALRCQLSGKPPATLAEFTIGGGGGGAADDDFYDISVVDGFNLPMEFACNGAGEGPIRCRDPGCADGNQRPGGDGKVRRCNADSDYHVVFCPN